jgi:hypothetical protein
MNKYVKVVRGNPMDVYDIIRAYSVVDPAIQHAIKKLLRYGSGDKSLLLDVLEARDSLEKYIDHVHASESGFKDEPRRVNIEDEEGPF